MGDKDDELEGSQARRGGTGSRNAAQRQRSRSQAVVGVIPKKNVSSEEVKLAVKQVDPVKQAVIWVKKAKVGSAAWIDKVDEHQFWYYCLSKRTQPLGYFAKYVLVLLGFFRPAATCQGSPTNCAAMNRTLYTFGVPGIPYAWLSIVVACLMYGCIVFRMLVRRRALGADYVFKPWHKVTAALIPIGVVTAIISIWVPQVGTLEMLSRPLLFVSVTKSVRQGVTEVAASIPGSLDVLFCMIVMVILFLWMAMVMFVGTAEGTADFPNWYEGFVNLYTLFTSANSPAVYMPAYNANKASFIFFFLYMIIVFYLLQNVLLAKVYDSYKSVVKLKFKNVHENQRLSLSKAFALLCGRETGTISLETWKQFILEYCHPQTGGIRADNLEDTGYIHFRVNIILKVFHQIDVEKMGQLNFDQFKGILVVFFDRDVYIPAPSQHITARYLVRLQSFFEKGFTIYGRLIHWDKVVDCVISVGTVLCFALSVAFSEGTHDGPLFWIPLYTLLAFTAFYIIGLHIWIFALGFSEFWYSKPLQHPFEFISVYGLMILSICWSCDKRSDADTYPWLSAFILLHMVRGMRLLPYIGPLQELFAILKQLMPIFKQMFIVFFIIIYMFAFVGVAIFGGVIYTTNPALVGTGYAGSGYWLYNFNSPLNAMVTLFMLMLGNNWYVLADGFNRAAGTSWCEVYFIGYFVVINIFMVHVLMALILDGTTVMTAHLRGADDEGAGRIQKRQSLLRKAAGDYSAQYMMRKVLNEDGEFFGGNVGDEPSDSDDDSVHAAPAAAASQPMRASIS